MVVQQCVVVAVMWHRNETMLSLSLVHLVSWDSTTSLTGLSLRHAASQKLFVFTVNCSGSLRPDDSLENRSSKWCRIIIIIIKRKKEVRSLLLVKATEVLLSLLRLRSLFTSPRSDCAAACDSLKPSAFLGVVITCCVEFTDGRYRLRFCYEWIMEIAAIISQPEPLHVYNL